MFRTSPVHQPLRSNGWTCRVVRVLPHTKSANTDCNTFLMLDRWGPKHVELTNVMNKLTLDTSSRYEVVGSFFLQLRNGWTCRVVRVLPPTACKTLLKMDRWGPKHVELTSVMNKLNHLKHCVSCWTAYISQGDTWSIQYQDKVSEVWWMGRSNLLFSGTRSTAYNTNISAALLVDGDDVWDSW